MSHRSFGVQYMRLPHAESPEAESTTPASAGNQPDVVALAGRVRLVLSGILTLQFAVLAILAWWGPLGPPPFPRERLLLLAFPLQAANVILVWLLVRRGTRLMADAVALAGHHIEERRRAEEVVRDREAALETVVAARDRTEAQLRQSQKMEALGQLAGGVAHDFNNLLTLMHGHLGILMAGAGPLAAEDSLGAIDAALSRAATLTRQLLMFSRRQVLNVRPMDLNEHVTKLVKLIARLLGEAVHVDLRPLADLPRVEADGALLDQVLMNLCLNARDAMLPDGGRLTISTNHCVLTEADLPRHRDGRPGRFACLSVADTGVGMSPATLAQIFQPFFTTKEPGRGTGLGLATVYGIVRQHQGWIEVESEEGKGTEFRVYLPVSEAVPEARETKPSSPVLVRGGGRVLLVEDEEEVRDLLASQLRDAGYEVEEAASGAEALEWWHRAGDGIDLVLTDMVMPNGMNGRKLVEQLRAKHPGLRTVFMSGYSLDLAAEGVAAEANTWFLQKPFTAVALTEAVRRALSEDRV